MSYTICSRFKGEHIVYAGYTICTSREHIVYGAFCGSTVHGLGNFCMILFSLLTFLKVFFFSNRSFRNTDVRNLRQPLITQIVSSIMNDFWCYHSGPKDSFGVCCFLFFFSLFLKDPFSRSFRGRTSLRCVAWGC